jgi:HAD superfamily hydrolase (TIGR01509 family)
MAYGLVFDLDGVLADTEGLSARVTIAMYEELYGVTFTFEDFVPYIGTGAYRYVEGPAKDAGLELRSLEEAVEARHVRFVEALERGECDPCPGAHALVDAAYAHPDWVLAIATSSPQKKAEATLKAIEMDTNKFDIFVNGDSITHKKPHPEIYERAAKDLGLDPAQCVAVEDAITGLDSAVGAGMKTLAVTSSFSADKLAHADRVVPSLEEVTVDSLKEML